MALNTARATSALARVHAVALCNSVTELLRTNLTMAATITTFLLSYATAAYILVSKGLTFVHAVPLLGPMLTERLVYLLFFSFFVMLVVSNATITGMGLFRMKETGWLLTLPLTHRSLVLWKTLEGMVLASWGLLLLSAPLLAAIGQLYDAGPLFFFVTLPSLICLVAVAAHLSTWVLLMLMRWMRWSWIKPVIMGLGAGLTVTGIIALTTLEKTLKPTDISASISQILHHTDAFTHPLLPSTWVAEVVLSAARDQTERVWFYTLLLASWAMAALLLTIRLSTALFYPAWTRSLLSADTRRARSVVARFRIADWLPLSRIGRSLVVKDIQTFAREPAQWGQSAVIFSLLFLYTANLRRIVFDPSDVFWGVVTSYLNLLVCALALSTLTTRFIFPQVSMEGRRIWVLGLAPLPLDRLLTIKLGLSTIVTGLVISLLTFLSCWSLHIPLDRTLFFLGIVWCMAFGLNGLALGMGTIFPNFKESNPAKIVSGFGGTLCLISSFIYIATTIVLAILPALSEFGSRFSAITHWLPFRSIWPSFVAILGLTFLFGLLPFALAKKRIKSLDYFKDV